MMSGIQRSSVPALAGLSLLLCGVTGSVHASIDLVVLTPTVLTTSASSITTTSATTGGNVTDQGSHVVVDRGVCWNTTGTPTSGDNTVGGGVGAGVFTCNMTGLTPDTTYYVRAYAINSQGISYGSQIQFTTAAETPTVTTTAPSNITASSAQSGGNVTDQGGAAVTARGVCWSRWGTPTINDNTTSDGTGTGAFTSNITGLSPGATYYVRAYATNSKGTSYGDQELFTTDPVPPTVTTADASDITTNSAVSGGELTDLGGTDITAFGVCWNTIGSPTINDYKTVGGFDKMAVAGEPAFLKPASTFACSLANLSPGTTYYVRAYATNSAGTGYGNEVQFTTIAVAPTVTTAAVSNITSDSAACGGEVASTGGASVTARGVCWNTTGTPTVDDDKTTDGTGAGAFTSSITGLDPDTTYYVRAYATNSKGVSYGAERTFSTTAFVAAPNLRVTVQAANRAANVGDEVGFTVDVRNLGDASATGVTLRFPLPPNTTFVGVWLTGDQSSQSTPLDAYVDGDDIVVELGDISAAEGLALDVVLEAKTSGAITLTASAVCEEKPSQVTAQADTEVEVDDAYIEIIRTATPLNPCGLMGFASPLLLMLGLAAMKRRG